MKQMMDANQLPVAVLLDSLKASEHGLTAIEAKTRLAEVGPNEPAAVRSVHGILQVITLLGNPLVLILLLASIVSAFLGEQVSAAIIVVVVTLSIAINFYQTYHSQRAVE